MEVVVYFITAKMSGGLLEDTDEKSGDGRMYQEEQDNAGSDCPIAHCDSLSRIDEAPNSKTDQHNEKRHEEVDQKVHVGSGNSVES